MPDLDIVAVLVSATAAFVAGAAYYAVLGEQLAVVSDAAADREQMAPWEVAVELVRCLVLAAVVAGLASQGDVDDWTGGLILGAVLWIGFPLVLWTGAMIHEKTPAKLAAIHAGDAGEAAHRRVDRERVAVAHAYSEDMRSVRSLYARSVSG